MPRQTLDYKHGDRGIHPSDGEEFQSNERPDSEVFDWFWYNVTERIKGHAEEFNRLDSDDDGVVDGADGASTYSDDGTTQVVRPTDIDFLDKLDVTDDGDGTVSIDTTALDEEEVEDAVSNLLSAGSNLSWTYDDAGDTLTIDTTALNESEVQTWVNNNADVPNADTVDGEHASAFANASHETDTTNPHNVTDSQTGAATALSNHSGDSTAHHDPVPSGVITMWSGTTSDVPSGWTLCDGTDGTPDLRDRFIVGAGNQYAADATGGEEQHTLTVSEMPSHTHDYKRIDGSNSPYDEYNGHRATEQTRTTTATGGDEAHENRPPYYSLAYIMKL